MLRLTLGLGAGTLGFACFVISLGVLAAIPGTAPIRRATIEALSQKAIVENKDYAAVFGRDSYSDCLLLKMSIFRHPSVWLDALDTIDFYTSDEAKVMHPCAQLQTLVNQSPPPEVSSHVDAKYQYTRYWLGSRHLFALLTSYLSPRLKVTQNLYELLSYGLIITLLLSGFLKPAPFNYIVGVIALGLLLGLGMNTYGSSIVQAPAFICGLAASVVFVGCAQRLRLLDSRVIFVFCSAAMLLYFDVWTGALPFSIAMFVFLNYFLHVRSANLRGLLWRYLWSTGAIVASFVAGCAMALLLRWAAASAIYPAWTVISNYIGQARWRVSSEILGYRVTRLQVLNALWAARAEFFYGSEKLATVVLITSGCCWLVGSIALIARAIERRSVRVATDLLALVSSASLVVGWFLVVTNHTYIHAWFVGRIITLPAGLGFASVLLSAWWWTRRQETTEERSTVLTPTVQG